MTIKGKTVFITGASRGIGRELAVAYAKGGANLFITYNSTPPKDTLLAISEHGAEAQAVKLDVSDSSAVDEAVKSCVERFGTVDVLVNNAGITKDGLLIRMKESDWDDVIDANLKGAFNMMKSVSKIMIKKRVGKIVNIGSIVGSMGNPGQANYSASKAGLIGLTKSVARELASRNIQVNLVAPGYIETDMTDELNEKQKETILESIPLKKLGTTADVANSVLFLSSSASDYITGHVLHVNGGMYM